MEEYHDGTFGEIKPLHEKMAELLEKGQRLDEVTKLHIGSEQALSIIKQGGGPSIEQRIDRLEHDVHALHVKLDRMAIALNIGDRSQIVRAESMSILPAEASEIERHHG